MADRGTEQGGALLSFQSLSLCLFLQAVCQLLKSEKVPEYLTSTSSVLVTFTFGCITLILTVCQCFGLENEMEGFEEQQQNLRPSDIRVSGSRH